MKNRKRKREKHILSALAGIKYLIFEDTEGNTEYLLYNDAVIGESEAKKILDDSEFMNPNVCSITKEQFENIFLITAGEDTSKIDKPKRKSELAQYREFKRAKSNGLLDDLYMEEGELYEE